MYECKAYLWNKESLMVCNLEHKQKKLKYLYKYLSRWFNIYVASVSTNPLSTIELQRNDYSKDKFPPGKWF